jgi:Terminase large subunit, T4likevirus-type, N-terminal
MPYAAKTDDWRKLPVEVRQSLLDTLMQRPTVSATDYLTPLAMAEALGIKPDPWQADVFQSEDRQTILNCSRQSGKSTVSALLALHQTVYVPKSLSLVLAPSQRQSIETFRKIVGYYNELESAPGVEQESALKLELANGSRVQVLPGSEKTVRGFSGVSLLIVDEAARVEDELYQAVRPMLAVSGGRLILLSTPFGSRGFFFQEWAEGGADWQRVKVTADECPRISKDWLEKERKRIGDWWYSQEYQCIFVDSLEACFSFADIAAAITSEVEPLWKL